MRMRWMIFSLIAFVVLLTFIFISGKNKEYSRVHFINDEKVVMNKYESTVPLQVIFGVNYLPEVKIVNPELLFEIWSKLKNLPVFDYVKGDKLNKEEPIFKGKVYFLNRESKDIQVSGDIKIGDKLYGMEDNDAVKYVRNLMKKKVFSVENLLKAIKSKKNLFVETFEEDANNKNEMVTRLCEALEKATPVEDSKEIGTVLVKHRKPVQEIKFWDGKHEILRFEILNDEYFSVYYEGHFVELLRYPKGKLTFE
jgi:hypothetical protein